MSTDNLKFRVWDSGLKCYRNDDVNEHFILTTGGDLVFLNNIYRNIRPADTSRFIIERCTGFKDANGRLIYEGDIIERRDAGFEGKYFLRAIYFVPHFARFCEIPPDSGMRYPIDANSAAECRVIGNINENRELIGSKSLYIRFEKENKGECNGSN